MIDDVVLPRINVDIDAFRRSYDREPFGFSHPLHHLELFAWPSLVELARLHTADDYFVASSAASERTRFYDVDHGKLHPSDAIADIDRGAYRVILKRPERYDRRFRELLNDLLAQVKAIRGWPDDERVVRINSAILVNSVGAITPVHFDPEVSFFFQIAGDKSYHLFDPASLSEQQLERFYVRGKLDIGIVEMPDRAREFVFELGPGSGMHQPQNTPHWVRTRTGPSISYVVSLETDTGQALGRTRGFNFLERRLGLHPAFPGKHPRIDAWKSSVMQFAFGTRKALLRR